MIKIFLILYTICIQNANATTPLATAGNQSTAITAINTMSAKITNPLPVSGTVTSNAGTNLNTSLLCLDSSVTAMSAKLPSVLGSKLISTSMSVNIASDQTVPVSGTFWQSTQPVSIASLPALTTGSAVIGHVINDASSAVIGHVIVDTAPSTAVTNAGTFATQSTLSAETTKVIGTVNQGTSPWVNNVSQINGVTPLMGNGITGTGSQRVTIASDNTAFSVNATLAAETTKVIGTVNQGTSPWVSSATQSGTWTVQPGNTPNTSPWLVSINDGTNTAKVQAASTAAVAADKALTVVQSPNGGNPCMNPSATLLSISGATSGTAAVQIIGLSGTTKIYICAMSIIGVSGTTPTFSLVQGTGSNCVTSQTVLVTSWSTTAGSIYAFANPVAVGVAGQEVCYLDTGTTPIQRYTITYVQQ